MSISPASAIRAASKTFSTSTPAGRGGRLPTDKRVITPLGDVLFSCALAGAFFAGFLLGADMPAVEELWEADALSPLWSGLPSISSIEEVRQALEALFFTS